jgi:hypothetical protein
MTPGFLLATDRRPRRCPTQDDIPANVVQGDSQDKPAREVFEKRTVTLAPGRAASRYPFPRAYNPLRLA